MTGRGASPVARAWLTAALIAVSVTGADQLSKEAIERNLVPGEVVAVAGPLELTHVTNTGIAFGLAGGGGIAIVIFTAVALAAMLAIFARQARRPGMPLAVGLLVGGAVGNLIDRIAQEAVTDFVKLPFWPSFNVADVAITVGVLILAWIFLRAPAPADADAA